MASTAAPVTQTYVNITYELLNHWQFAWKLVSFKTMVIFSAERLDDIPKGSVILNEDEALEYQWDLINEWNGKRNMWV